MGLKGTLWQIVNFAAPFGNVGSMCDKVSNMNVVNKIDNCPGSWLKPTWVFLAVSVSKNPWVFGFH